MRLLRATKQWVKRRVMSFPATSAMYFRSTEYSATLEEKALRAKIQQVGHRMDLNITNDKCVPLQTLREFEFLLKEIHHHRVAIDEAVSWAFGLYLVAKHRLYDEYLSGLVAAQSTGTASESAGDLVAAIRQRRSVRKWTLDPIDLAEVQHIIDLAKWAPSSCNRQLWKVLFVSEQHHRQFLTGYFSNTFWLRAPLLLVVLMQRDTYGHHEKHYAYLDAGAFIQNMLLLLHLHNFGACWIGFARWDTLDNVHVSRDLYARFYGHFSLDETLVPVSMVALGRSAGQPRTPPRQQLSSILVKGSAK